MAVYAAYRHIELDNIGYGKKRVLKPPGGGSSDIFGAAEPAQNSPRRARNNLQSSVFGPPPTTNGEITPRGKSGSDSYSRLFGPAESRPQSASKNRLKSNINLCMDAGLPTKDSNFNLHVKNSSASAVDGITTIKDGNPVTGEGYTNGEKPQSPNSSQSAAPTTNGTHSAPAQRTRVPPGGFSSGLW